MKNFLFIFLFITLSIIVNSCDEGFKDESTEFSLVLYEVTPVPSLTTDTTPDYTFSSNVAGNMTYGGLCSSSTTTVNQGNNKITLAPLSNGTYSDCSITVKTPNVSLINSLTMSSFTIDTSGGTLEEVTAVTTPTNDTTPNYTFSTNQAGTITYGGSCSSSTTSAISGNNTITLVSLSDGTYSNCTITLTNSSAKSVTLNISPFVIDATAPTVTQVTAVTTPTNDNTPNYTFSTNEAGIITYGGSCSSSTTSATTGDNTITLVSLSDGTYSNCTITVTDSLGNASSALSVRTFVIDTTATANFTAATDNEGTVTGVLTSGDTTDDTALVLSGTNESGSSVMVYNGSTELGAATVSGTSWSYSATLVNGTTYQFNVKETDLAGNTSAATSYFTVTGDTTAPAVNFTAATDDVGTLQGALTSGNTTDDTTLVLSGTNEAGSSVMVYNGNAPLGTAIVSGSSWSYSANVANGTTYQFNVKATDLAGKTSAATSNFTVTGDTTSPTVRSVDILSALGIQSDLLNNGDVLSVIVTFSEVVLVTPTPQLTLVVGVTNRTATYTSGSESRTLLFQYMIRAGETDSDGISIGANALALISGTIRDAAGNNAFLTHSLVPDNTNYKVDTTVTANFTKATDDVGTVTGDFTSDNTTDDTALVLSGTNEAGSTVKVYHNTTELGTANAVSTTSWSYTATVVNGTTHLFNVRETDLAGNTSAATSNLAVTGDTTAPTAPSVSGTTPTGNTTPTWSWSAGGEGNGTYRYKLDNSDLTSGATQTTSTSYTPGSGISEGSHILYVQERDAAGNWSSAGSRTIVIDTTAPTAPSV